MAPITLSPAEARVLGALMEKAITTPDQYPLSLNSLRLACNQSTNRDPVVDYDDATVQHALDGLRDRGLASRNKAPGERAIKFRHHANQVLELSDAHAALIGVLLLRGAQTPGELKQRCERIHSFATTAEVEGGLAALVEREMVVVQPRRPGQKERRWIDLVTAHDGSALIGLEAEGVSERAAHDPAQSLHRGSHSGVAAASVIHAAASTAPKTMTIVNPASGVTIRTVEIHNETEIAAKLKRARRAQRDWAARAYEDRAAAVSRWRDLIVANAEACAQITTQETGKAIAQSRNELNAVSERMSYFIDNAHTVLVADTVTIEADLEEHTTYEPRGVVAHISAWNYPYFVGLNSLVPALLTGNAVLYKPSELATLTGLKLVDLAHAAGIPADVLQCVTGAAATGAALVTSGVDLVGFTGSFATGRAIARVAAERLIPLQLELGGKDAAYVCDDVDIEAAAEAVAGGAFYNAGQSCCAVERVYVHERIWEPFVAAFVRSAEQWQLGDPSDDDTTLGALARPQQAALLAQQISDATEKGARVLLGGEAPNQPGNWFPATVVVDVDHSMAIMREESFGPIIGLMRVVDDVAAVERFGESEYGLTGSIMTQDRDRAERFLRQIDVGTVYWNCNDRTTPRLPWAGRRHSGLGVSMGLAGIKAFVHEKSWHLRP